MNYFPLNHASIRVKIAFLALLFLAGCEVESKKDLTTSIRTQPFGALILVSGDPTFTKKIERIVFPDTDSGYYSNYDVANVELTQACWLENSPQRCDAKTVGSLPRVRREQDIALVDIDVATGAPTADGYKMYLLAYRELNKSFSYEFSWINSEKKSITRVKINLDNLFLKIGKAQCQPDENYKIDPCQRNIRRFLRQRFDSFIIGTELEIQSTDGLKNLLNFIALMVKSGDYSLFSMDVRGPQVWYYRELTM